ncbi:SH3 domain-containing protein [Leptospira licerasiae]|uniref:SH3 domain protein n=1 Tax=Leptospira licerasiae str. MMD4847 TaxID=1049971 RepID=A0ABP2RDJ4_9LEPT|nr:SH3 domain-containing protein [Leptospira licerasiae]EIE02032.1 bacterial SH3 domain protein [Leptospira licerasiae serovar Varillal str. VAR 010]EJZ41454.1 SH3 domain protein [Leptospira licerasiae str. MMD4847]
MIRFLKYFSVALYTTFLLGCFSNYQSAYVNNGAGLRIRSAPKLSSEKMGTVPYKGEVKIVEKDQRLAHIDGFENYWYKIKSEEGEGWVFGGYLSFKHPDFLPPGSNSYTGLVYHNPIQSLKLIRTHIINENLYLNIYQADPKHIFAFLERKNQISENLTEWRILHAITLDIPQKDEEILNRVTAQCFTPGLDGKEIILAILKIQMHKTGVTMGNHYELALDRLKVRKAWTLSEDESFLQPVLRTKGIECTIFDPGNQLKAISE